jgi:hypothetical protein
MNDDKRESLTGEPDPCPLCGGRLRQIPHGAKGLKVFVVLERSVDGSTTVMQVSASKMGADLAVETRHRGLVKPADSRAAVNEVEAAYAWDMVEMLVTR